MKHELLTMESFMEYCNEMDPAEEKLSAKILAEKGKPLGKIITLYHGSPVKMDVVETRTVNMGNRLEGKHMSSFWTDNYDGAVCWALDFACMKLYNLPYINDIDKHIKYIPDYTLSSTDKDGNVVGKLSVMEAFKKYEKQLFPLYVYTITVDTKYVGRGHAAIGEYTIDHDIKPGKCKAIGFGEAKKYMKVIPPDEFDQLNEKCVAGTLTSKKQERLRDKLIYRDYRTTMQERSRQYEGLKQVLGIKKAIWHKKVLEG